MDVGDYMDGFYYGVLSRRDGETWARDALGEDFRRGYVAGQIAYDEACEQEKQRQRDTTKGRP